MTQSNKTLRNLILSVAAFFVLAAVAMFVVDQARKSREQIPVLGQLPEFQFTEQSGAPFGLQDMKGKLNVVDFIFTHCKGPCPIMASKMSSLYKAFEGSNKVQLISISVDPERDSLPVLREYAERQGVTDNRWVFLRAPIEQVVDLSENGFMLAAEDLPGNHTTKFVLVDERGQIRGYFDGLSDASINILKGQISQLARELP
ncbi:MAG: SCO family protein [bacterium]|jgi:protein SCO1/2